MDIVWSVNRAYVYWLSPLPGTYKQSDCLSSHSGTGVDSATGLPDSMQVLHLALSMMRGLHGQLNLSLSDPDVTGTCLPLKLEILDWPSRFLACSDSDTTDNFANYTNRCSDAQQRSAFSDAHLYSPRC